MGEATRYRYFSLVIFLRFIERFGRGRSVSLVPVLAIRIIPTGAHLVQLALAHGKQVVCIRSLIAHDSYKKRDNLHHWPVKRNAKGIGVKPCVVSQKFLIKYRSDFSASSRRRNSLGLLALATYANADRSKKRAALRARWHGTPWRRSL